MPYKNIFNMRKLNLLFCFITIFASSVFAQSIDVSTATLRWNSTSFTDQLSGTSMDGTCQFLTYGTTKIDWVQKGGKLVYTLTVSSVDGTWTNANEDGSITYNVSLNDMSGTLAISKSGGTITIVLNLSGPSDKINNSYSITNFDIL